MPTWAWPSPVWRAGTVYVGLAFGDEVTSQLVVLPGDRERVRQFATISAVDLLRHRLLAEQRAG